MRNNQPVTQREYVVRPDSAIISHTDLKSLITYVNDDFLEASGYSREESLGQPHNLLRHPDMPTEAFRDIWATIQSGRPWQGLVKKPLQGRRLLLGQGHHFALAGWQWLYVGSGQA
jgi:aerotaxis receptor